VGNGELIEVIVLGAGALGGKVELNCLTPVCSNYNFLFKTERKKIDFKFL